MTDDGDEVDAPGDLQGVSAVPLILVHVAFLLSALLLASCGTDPSDGANSDGGLEVPIEASTSAAGPSFPGPEDTGVPDGVQLSPYTGPCQITTDDVVIEAKTVNCSLDIRAANVLVSNSKLNGPVILDTDLAGADRWSLTLQDSEVDGGTSQIAAVSAGNTTILRADIHGGQTSVQCGEKARSCVVRDSWLHGQYLPPGSDWHLGGFLSNGGMNIELTGNTLACDAAPTTADGGCTGNLNLLPDFAPISHVTIDGNLFIANPGSSYCTYGGDSASKPFPDADNVVYSNNVFERGSNGQCAAYGPVTSFDVAGTGNLWINNRWDDGSPVLPSL